MKIENCSVDWVMHCKPGMLPGDVPLHADGCTVEDRGEVYKITFKDGGTKEIAKNAAGLRIVKINTVQ